MLKPSYNNWFVPFKQVSNSAVNLFCFHYGGGSASVFQEWSKDLIDGVDLIAIQMPGREERFNEPLLYKLSDVVDKLCMNFDNYIDKSFVFFGHSIGALIAFEFVRALRNRGMPQPEHLIVSGTKAPQAPFRRQHIHQLPDSQFITELKKYNGIPNAIVEDKELMSLILPTLRADFCVAETYNYLNEEPLTCPLTALGGLNDHTFILDDFLQWEQQTTGVFKHHILPDDHFFIKTSYKEVLKIVNQVLYEQI